MKSGESYAKDSYTASGSLSHSRQQRHIPVQAYDRGWLHRAIPGPNVHFSQVYMVSPCIEHVDVLRVAFAAMGGRLRCWRRYGPICAGAISFRAGCIKCSGARSTRRCGGDLAGVLRTVWHGGCEDKDGAAWVCRTTPPHLRPAMGCYSRSVFGIGRTTATATFRERRGVPIDVPFEIDDTTSEDPNGEHNHQSEHEGPSFPAAHDWLLSRFRAMA